jgi:hypothetical protein
MRPYPTIAVAFALVACASSQAPVSASTSSSIAGSGPIVTTAAISEADLRHRLFLIADDSMMGRESGSLGNYKTADYVASEFRRLGLEPAGDNGTYFQTVPFWSAAIDPNSRLEVGGQALEVIRDFVPATLPARARTVTGAQAVLAGPVNDTTKWISADQAAGKIVVFYVPESTSMRGLSIGSARWRDAVAVAPVVLEGIGSETVARLKEGRPVADTGRNPNTVPTLWLTRRAATVLLGGDPSTMAPGTVGPPVKGYFDIARTPVSYPARNVVGILRGSDPVLRNQYVSLTAHNDHVGFDRAPVDHDSLRAFNRVIRPMGADSPPRQPTAAEWSRIRTILDSLRKVNRPRLDSIRNGADDDGSGTVALLEIAEAMSKGTRPKRSVLFVNHTGEEAGLLGSRWFSDHPTVPLDSIVGEIDQDMIGRGKSDDFPLDGVGAATPTYLEVIGAKRLSREFGDSVEAANAREPLPFNFDYRYDAPGHPLQYYCRADHYSYARYGIPSMAISRGEHLDYHQVTDEPQYISYPDLARVARMVYSAASVIGNMPQRPKLDAAKQTNPNTPCRQ